MLGKKSRSNVLHDILAAFVKSWELHGSDETSIYSGALDILRAYLGDRPCCIWKTQGEGIQKVTERGVLDLFLGTNALEHQNSLQRALVTGAPEFDPCPINLLSAELKMGLDGLLHIPIKSRDMVSGLLTIAVTKKEARDREFVQPFESFGRLLAIAVYQGVHQQANLGRESRLQAEVDATTRELESTNQALIDRVKELKTLYKELQKRVEELTLANRAKDEFLSIVSHELRTPLTSLSGFISVILDEEAGPINEAQKKFLGIAKQSAIRLNLIISDLLDVSRIEAGRLNLEMGECLLSDILIASYEGLRASAASKGIQLNLSLAPDLPKIWGDPNRLQQVSDNLISNAIKFTDKNGQIDVSAIEMGDFLQVTVKDNGPGLEDREKEKVFDMFYQVDTSTRRPAGGAGLGLAIARGIVVMHGGQISVESEKGNGATFKFLLPRRKALQKVA